MSAIRNRLPFRPRLAPSLAALAGIVLAGLVACSESMDAPAPFEPQFAKGGGGGPPVKVTGTDPTGAEQDTTLDVRVLGANFEPGSDAEFKLGGVATGKVRTNSTSFVSSDELVANITLDADADLGLYDVEVRTPPGKKGVGTEMFEVRVKGGGGNLTADVSMSGALTTAAANRTAVDQDNPQVLQVSMTDFAVNVNLAQTHANAVAEWADPDAADECVFELPLGNYDRDAVAQALLRKLAPGDTVYTFSDVQLDKLAVAASAESHDSFIGLAGGMQIGRANGANYYGFLLVTSANDVNDATTPRVFEVHAGHGTIGTLVDVEGIKQRAGSRGHLHCRLQDAIAVTVSPST